MFHGVVLFFLVVLNGYYLVTSVYAFRSLRRYARRISSIELNDLIDSAGAPPITLIVPAYNEEDNCLEAMRSFLSLTYPEYEVIFVNDGSTDTTLELLEEAFDLVPTPRSPTADLATEPVHEIYQSQTHPKLWVIDKENGQRADAVNAGLNYCRTPLFCATDADSIVERDALERIVRPFLEDDRTVASGGIVRVGNGCEIENGQVKNVRLPENLLARFQVLEYLRSFLSGRVAWHDLRIMFIISGAFGLFRRSLVIEAGGLARDTVGEDLELTIRLHRYCREEDIPYRIAFVPDPVVWTEVPETLRDLGSQRDRWQRGVLESMFRHITMLFNPRYGRIGLVAYPYFFLEMMGPVVEFLGYIVFVWMIISGFPLTIAIVLIILAVALGTTLSVIAIGLEELGFRRYERFSELLRLLGLTILENFGYRQILTYYRIKGTVNYLLDTSDWGTMRRKGLNRGSSS